jgi:hypothetical protein
LDSADIQQAALRARLPRLKEAVATMMELQLSNAVQPGVYIGAPIYAKIERVEIAGGELHLNVRRDPVIEITATAFTGPLGGNSFPAPKNRIELHCTRTNDQQFYIDSYRGKIKELEATDWLQVHLFDDRIGEIPLLPSIGPRLPGPASQFVRLEERHRLLAVFERFCNYSQFRSLLLDPAEVAKRKINPAAAFELHVSWLFSLMGFSVIVLGEYEKLAAINNPDFQLGSVDILAAHPRDGQRVFIIGCTINAPKPEDHNNLKNTKAVIEREIKSNTFVQPVIVTAASHCVPERAVPEPSARDLGQSRIVTILDREGLDEILARLQTGDANSALQLVDDCFW